MSNSKLIVQKIKLVTEVHSRNLRGGGGILKLECFAGNSSNRKPNYIPSETYIYMPFKNADKINIKIYMKMPPVLLNPACPDYPVVHLEHLIIPDPTDQSGIRPSIKPNA